MIPYSRGNLLKIDHHFPLRRSPTLPHQWVQKFVARQIFIQCSRNGEGVSSVQSLSHVRLLGTQRTAARQASLSFTNSRSLLQLMSIQSVMPHNHLIFCCPLLLLPSIFPSIRVFSNKSVLHIRWPKCWSFIFNISPSNEDSGLTFFRIDWLDLLCSKDTFSQITSWGQAFYRKGWRRVIRGRGLVSHWFVEISTDFLECTPLCCPWLTLWWLDRNWIVPIWCPGRRS